MYPVGRKQENKDEIFRWFFTCLPLQTRHRNDSLTTPKVAKQSHLIEKASRSPKKALTSNELITILGSPLESALPCLHPHNCFFLFRLK